MTDKQKLEIEAAKARKELRALALNEDATAEQIAEQSATVDNLEARAAALPEPDPEPNDGDGEGDGDGDGDAETRERRKLADRSKVSRYLGLALEGRAADGAEGEYCEALGMSRDSFPLRLLAPEARATTDVDASANQATWVDRLFGDSAARWLGVAMPSVAAGTAAYPVTTAGASGAQRGRAEAAGDAAWTVGVTELKPTRNVTRAVFSVEDAARLPGVEAALRRDLRRALVDAIDVAIFTGDAGANENTADVTGLNTAAGVVEETITQALKTGAGEVLSTFVDFVDGKAAAMLGDVRAVLSIGAYRLWAGSIASTVENDTLLRFLGESGLPAVRVREGIATGTAADDFGAFIGRQRGMAGAGVAPVWDAARLIRDPYSNAAKGEIAVTLTTLWGFGLPRASNFGRIKFVA